MSELFNQIFGIVSMIFAIGFPLLFLSKSKTWFRGYGACRWLNSTCLRKAEPRSDMMDSWTGKPGWLCKSHYEESMGIRDYVNRVASERRVVSSEEAKRFKESGHRTW